MFGSSGVRALANVDMTPILAARIGLAVATFSKAKKVLVARDTRVSGPLLENALASGLTSGGASVQHLGILPAPVLAFLTEQLSADASVMITASHNPPQYNGVKIFDRHGVAYDEQIQGKIERIMKHEHFRLASWQDVGKDGSGDWSSSYVETVRKAVRLRRKWRVVVDPGCGATYDLAPRILKDLGCRVTALNAQPDGFFPARSPEPNARSLIPLTRVVRALGADAGLAYDGDGDRAAFIDERGRFADFDRVLAAYAAHITRKMDGGIVVTNVEASMCVEKMVKAFGGKVIRTKVGDVYISEAVKKRKAIFGGEPCGAWTHPQFHSCPDGILSSVLLLEALDEEGKSLGELISETPQYPILRENVACSNSAKYWVVKSICESLRSAFPKYEGSSKVDGVRLSLRNGWILVRASGTEPVVRLTVEGESLKVANEIMEKGMKLVKGAIGGNRP